MDPYPARFSANRETINQTEMVAMCVPLLVAISCLASLQATRSSLESTVSTGEYFGETYIRRGASGSFVFLVGEPLKIKIAIGNPSGAEESFRFIDETAQNMFVVRAARDGVPVTLDISFERGVLVVAERMPFDISAYTTLQPRERVEWVGRVQDPLEPGEYVVSITTTAIDRQGRPIVPNVRTYQFEVRALSINARVERTFREAVRQYMSGSAEGDERAEVALEQLLQVHPTSFEAFVLRGDIARRRGDESAAVKAYTMAARILSDDSDALLVSVENQRDRQQRLERVKTRLLKQK